MQKILLKSASVAAFSFALASAAQAASSDMILGFNDAAGPPTAQNDYVIDLGAISAFTTSSTYSGVISSTLFNQAFGTDASALNNVAVGIAEGSGGTTYPKTLFLTSGSQPTAPTRSEFNNSMNGVNGVANSAIGVNPSTLSGGWSDSVAVSPTQIGSNATGGVAGNVGSNPLISLVNGQATLTLWETTQSSVTANGSAFSQIGTFTIDVNNDTINFTGVAVPEPSAGLLIIGGGLFFLALRRKLGGRNA